MIYGDLTLREFSDLDVGPLYGMASIPCASRQSRTRNSSAMNAKIPAGVVFIQPAKFIQDGLNLSQGHVDQRRHAMMFREAQNALPVE